ncbi:MAG TPA: COX15/CtaA family protein [Nevskiaceae bacterium]|nr:COX15/CtaA family protein [Nevskiaceae bacterium]
MPIQSWFSRINLITVVVCFVLVLVGAYVRLSDAGLGCPDWPGCYGQMVVPDSSHATATADALYPHRPVQAPKAWKEMAHRYLAGIVSLLVLVMAGIVVLARKRGLPNVLAPAILGVIIVQIVFGALTVTLLVMPIIVTTHLLLGLATLALLWWMWLRQRLRQPAATGRPAGVRLWATLALVVLACQIFLGGWVSTNYAAVACPDFPTCQGIYGLQTSLAPAFDLWHGLGVDYQGGILTSSVRATIHMVHRYGALATTLVLGLLALYLLGRGKRAAWRWLGVALLLALALQVAIGIGIVEMQFPLWLTDAHTGGAALLLLVVVLVNHYVWSARGDGVQES